MVPPLLKLGVGLATGNNLQRKLRLFWVSKRASLELFQYRKPGRHCWYFVQTDIYLACD